MQIVSKDCKPTIWKQFIDDFVPQARSTLVVSVKEDQLLFKVLETRYSRDISSTMLNDIKQIGFNLNKDRLVIKEEKMRELALKLKKREDFENKEA